MLTAQSRELGAHLPRQEAHSKLHRRLSLPIDLLQALCRPHHPRDHRRRRRRRRRQEAQGQRLGQEAQRQRLRPQEETLLRPRPAPQDHHHLPPLRIRPPRQEQHILCRRRRRLHLFLRRPLAPRLRHRPCRHTDTVPWGCVRRHRLHRCGCVLRRRLRLPAHRHAPARVETAAQLRHVGWYLAVFLGTCSRVYVCIFVIANRNRTCSSSSPARARASCPAAGATAA